VPPEPLPALSTSVQPRYCFVVGCQRSGTTVLARLLHSHISVVIGMERYKYLLNRSRAGGDDEGYGPPLFEPDRFFDFRPTDTNIRPPKYDKHYKMARRKFDEQWLRVVGDKIMPSLMDAPSAGTAGRSPGLSGATGEIGFTSVLVSIMERFPDPKFVFIYRDIGAVAGSFSRRTRCVGRPRSSLSDEVRVDARSGPAGSGCPLWFPGARTHNAGSTTVRGARAKAEQLRTTRRAPNPEIEQWLAQRVDPAIEQRWDTRFRRALHRFAPTS